MGTIREISRTFEDRRKRRLQLAQFVGIQLLHPMTVAAHQVAGDAVAGEGFLRLIDRQAAGLFQ